MRKTIAIFLTIAICGGLAAQPSHPPRGRDAAKSDTTAATPQPPAYKSGQAPLNISGTLGSTSNSSWNSRGYNKMAPFSMLSFANITFNVYEWKIPVMVNMSNINVSQFSFNAPTWRIGVTPTYRTLKIHLGHSSMNVSRYTFSNLTFLGAGLEYYNKWVRVAGFYGTLERATRYTYDDNRNTIQHLADSLLGLNFSRSYKPVFRRDAVAARLGFGSKKNYVDLSFFRAKDDINSLPETWTWSDDTTRLFRDSVVQARENLTVGLTARFNPWKWLTLSANGGASVYTADQTAPAVDPSSLQDLGAEESDVAKYKSVYDKLQMFFTPRYNTTIRFAGDAALGFKFKTFSANFTYRFIEAGYTSLGSTAFSQNVQALGASVNARMFRNRSILGASAYVQRNNLDKKQKSTNQVGSYSLNWRNNITRNTALTLNYNAVKQDQLDGATPIADDRRINQLAHTFMLIPSYTLFGFNEQTFSMNLTYLQNMNLNDKMKETISNVINTTTLTAGLGYDIYLRSKQRRYNVEYDFSLSNSRYNSYRSHAITIGGNWQIYSKKDKALSLNSSLTAAYNIALDTTSKGVPVDQVTDLVTLRNGRTNLLSYDRYRTDVFSVSGRIGGAFTYKQWHNLSLYLSVSNYSDYIIIGQHITTDIDIRANISYTYSFARRAIKPKPTLQQ